MRMDCFVSVLCRLVLREISTCKDLSLKNSGWCAGIRRGASLPLDLMLEVGWFSIFRFLDIIRSEIGQTLREELARSSGKIITSAFQHGQISPSPEETGSSLGLSGVPTAGSIGSANSDGLMGMPGGGASTLQTPEIQFQGVALMSTLVKLMPDWLWMNRPVFEALVRLWQSPARAVRLRNEQGLSLTQVSRTCLCFVHCCLVKKRRLPKDGSCHPKKNCV